MDPNNYNGNEHRQQLQQQMEQQMEQLPMQAGFAPRRQYDNMGNSPAALAAAFLANGAGVSGGSSSMDKPATMQNRQKNKKDKQMQAIQQQQQQQQQQQLQQHLAELSGAVGSTSSTLPVDDTLKFVNETDANGLAMKTPVSMLQEMLSRRGITPGYELVQNEGAIHEPTFRFRVSFKDKDTPFTAMGAGRSKKAAKHAAAYALIVKLIGVQLESQGNSAVAAAAVAAVVGSTLPGGNGGDGNGNNASAPGSGGDAGDKIVDNPIGWLQEKCLQRRWRPPSYETQTEEGLPHERLFTIACTVLNYREVGKGKSKKIAKRLAAHKMWTRLQELMKPLAVNWRAM